MSALPIKGYRRVHDIEFAVLKANEQLVRDPKIPKKAADIFRRESYWRKIVADATKEILQG